MSGSQPEKLSRIQREKRSAIKQAALDVFSIYGLRGATLDKIAQAAGLTKPNILYYYASKDDIYFDLLNGLLDDWVAPLRKILKTGDPLHEILNYMRAKLAMSREKPRESKLFATEILHGAPLTQDVLSTSLKEILDEKVAIIGFWITEGRLAPVNGYHLFFSIWSMTQHYADFDVQVKALLQEDEETLFKNADHYLTAVLTRTLCTD